MSSLPICRLIPLSLPFVALACLVSCGGTHPIGDTDSTGSRERFLTDFRSLSIGMARSDVDRIMGSYLRGSGWPAPPNAVSPWAFNIPGSPHSYQASFANGELSLIGCTIYRHSTAPEFDSDWGIVCFEDEVISTLEFSPD